MSTIIRELDSFFSFYSFWSSLEKWLLILLSWSKLLIQMFLKLGS